MILFRGSCNLVFIFIVNTFGYFAHLLARHTLLTMVDLTGCFNSCIRKWYVRSTSTSYMFIFSRHIRYSCCTFYKVFMLMYLWLTRSYFENHVISYSFSSSAFYLHTTSRYTLFTRVRTIDLKRCANPYNFCEKL